MKLFDVPVKSYNVEILLIQFTDVHIGMFEKYLIFLHFFAIYMAKYVLTIAFPIYFLVSFYIKRLI